MKFYNVWNRKSSIKTIAEDEKQTYLKKGWVVLFECAPTGDFINQ
jgi:hypothetical protein